MKAFLNALLSVQEFLWSLLNDGLHSILDLLDRKSGLEAEWGKETDIASRWNRGCLISRHRRLSRKTSYQNLLLCAPTGSGKTSAFLIKQPLLLRNCSIVITDPSKEIFNAVSGSLSRHFEIRTLNFSNHKESGGFNFLHTIESPYDIRLNKISDMLVHASLEKGGNTDPFWPMSVRNLLNVLMRLVLYQPKEQQHLASVLHALNTFCVSPSRLDLPILRTGDKRLLEQYKSIVATPEKTLQNIVASARAALQVFESEEVQKVTAYHTIDFGALRQRPTILFLHHSPSEGKMLASLIGLFFELLYVHLLDNPVQKRDLDLFILLEETAGTYIPILSQALSLTRKTRTVNFLCIQSQSQLRAMYHDEATNIMENCQTKIFLPGISDMGTLKQIETLSGRAQVKDPKTGMFKTAPLISADAVRTLGKNRTLILSGRNPIIKGRMSGYYTSPRYRRMTSLSPLPLQGDIPDGPISLIDFPVTKTFVHEAAQ